MKKRISEVHNEKRTIATKEILESLNDDALEEYFFEQLMDNEKNYFIANVDDYEFGGDIYA